jgi:hypothetical protein
MDGPRDGNDKHDADVLHRSFLNFFHLLAHTTAIMPATTTKRCLFLTILTLILCHSTNHAFVTIRAACYSPSTPQVGSGGYQGTTRTPIISVSNEMTTTTTKVGKADGWPTRSFHVARSSSITMLSAKKMGNKKKKTEEDDKIQQEWDAALLITFMTPWKNPNSIFVYMFGLLYLLGKYSESHRLP